MRTPVSRERIRLDFSILFQYLLEIIIPEGPEKL